MGRSGIYTITCKVNNKIYVGGTEDLKMRKHAHFSNLKRNLHVCGPLQTDFNLFGEENFTYEKLIKCKKKYLFSEEHYWCNLLDTHNPKFGYNIAPTNPNGRGGLAESSMLKSALKRMKPVVVLSTKGRFISEFGSIKEASHYLNLNASAVSASARGVKYPHYKGFVFVYKDVYIPEKDYSVTIQRKKHMVIMKDENNNVIKEFDNAEIAANFINGSQASIWRAMNGVRKTYKSHYWELGILKNQIE